jgi:PAS domain S-box-containing protein
MTGQDKVNILLVDDQPGKLLSYEAILNGIDANLLKASSGREALEHLLKTDVAVILVDVCMPDLDGFQLAAMIRDHPRFQKTAIIFISAILLGEMDSLRGYEMGAVDYVSVPVVPEVLRAKVRVFADLYRKTRQLEELNRELEERVAARTAELQQSTAQLQQSEVRRSLALAAGQMGSWEWDRETGRYSWDDGQFRIYGVEPETFAVTAENIRASIHPEDWDLLREGFENIASTKRAHQMEFRIRRPSGQIRWCMTSAAASIGENGEVNRISGVTFDVTERKASEEKQTLLAREVDHRAKNALALVQSILRLTQADTLPQYTATVEGRIRALSRAHTILSQSRWQGASLRGLIDEELAPFKLGGNTIDIQGPDVVLSPTSAQTIALALHELATNAAKYGALSVPQGHLKLNWSLEDRLVKFDWRESGGPETAAPNRKGFGTRIIVASIEQQLGGKVLLNWHREGLFCGFAIPLPTLVEDARSDFESGVKKDAELTPIILTGTNILVVEDEALVALAVNDTLVESGWSVIGPFSVIADARNVIFKTSISAAILDVNLNGDLVYPLAETLTDREIPFVFVTGYGVESIDPRFRKIQVLQKPIDRDILRRLFIKPKLYKGTEAIGATSMPSPL